MKFLHIPFLLVLTGMTVYVRDVLSLPFYGSRIFVVNLYVLLFGIILYLQSARQRRKCKEAYRHFVSMRPFVVFIWTVIIFLSINLLSNILNNEQDYFLLLQILNFVVGFIYLYLIIFNNGLGSFLRSFSIALWLLLVFQIFIFIFGSRLGVYGEITANKNGFSYLALFFYLLYCAYGEK
jgi:hypothetical protein